MAHRNERTAAWILFALAASCQSGSASRDGLPDSAPLRLVGPEVRIGAVDDPDYAFGAVRTMAVGPGGRLYSLHRGDAHVRIWTADGFPADTLGGEGQGPGEFTRPGDLGFFGDTLWVMDTYAYRVSYFDPSGAFLGSVIPQVDLDAAAAETEWDPPRPEAPLRDGTFIAQSPGWSYDVAVGDLTRTPYVHMGGGGETIGRVWTRPWRQSDVLALLDEDGRGGFFLTQPFEDAPLVETVEDGLLVVDRRAWGGEGPTELTVARMDLAGDTLWATSIPYDPVRLTAERVDSAVAEVAARSFDFRSSYHPGLTLAAFERDIAEVVFAPGWTPPARSLVVAEDGSVWIERFEPVPDEAGGVLRPWWIVGPDGSVQGSALTPDGLDLVVVTDEAVWGVEADELDVNYMVRYRLVGPGPS